MATKKETPHTARQDIRRNYKSQCQEKLGKLEGKERTQSDSGVPSSANWKPTNPFMSKQVYADATRPVYTAANHCGMVRILEGEKMENNTPYK